jgi:hypothetical protein
MTYQRNLGIALVNMGLVKTVSALCLLASDRYAPPINLCFLKGE